jgi:hypothetical protein
MSCSIPDALVRLAAVAVWALAVLALPVRAADGAVFLEVRPLRVEVTGRPGALDVAVVLEFAKRVRAEAACTRTARLAEAFVIEAARAPVAAAEEGGGADLTAFAARLKRQARRVLDGKGPDRVHVAPAGRARNVGLGAPRPFTEARDCIALTFARHPGAGRR